MITTILVDRTNFEQILPAIAAEMQTPFIGLDTETQDDNRHDGLNQFCKYDPITRKKAGNTKLVFDTRRTIMCGFSIYPEGSDHAYYVNLNHLDADNRVSWEDARRILDAKPTDSMWVAHNAPYEIMAFNSCYGYDVSANIACTLQLAVSAYGPDEYDKDEFIAAGVGGFAPLMKQIMSVSRTGYNPDTGDMSSELSELVGKIIAKESDAAHSYNGFVDAIAYGYGLKKAVKSHFGYDMTTFEQVLRGRAHMGQLTGAETASYGAEDAYWAVRLLRHLMTMMTPEALQAYINQENPMVPVYAAIWQGGMKVNLENIFRKRDEERVNAAEILRKMKAVVRELPFSSDLNAHLLKTEKWYVNGANRYRQQLRDWALSADNDDPYVQLQQVRGAVSNAWAAERGDPESNGPNLSHYMPMRVLLYDLLDQKPIMADGKVQSDGEARGKLKDRLLKTNFQPGIDLIDCMNKLAGVEQRMKLYLTPYTQLTDPETGRLYPVVSSMLASRRMGARDPNPMQLQKRGETTYVRGFFEGDNEDHLVVSCDWSAIELVEIGEFSADPEFIKAFGQIPHEDLHSGAAASILEVEVPGLTEDMFKSLKTYTSLETFHVQWGGLPNEERLFRDLKGQPLDNPIKYWRTEVGKGANFNYWYSGFLGTIGDRMGWSLEKTGNATERYRERFAVAENWRVNLIQEGMMNGFVTLPDGHRRVRWEATNEWFQYFTGKFFRGNEEDLRNYNEVVRWIARKIQKRAHNQLVNSMIQGSCATIAKRTVIRLLKAFVERGWDSRLIRFMIPIHDELVFSVHHSIALEAIHLIRDVMIDHPDIFRLCKLDASPSIGRTFEPYHPEKAPFGQVELFEAPKSLSFIPEAFHGKRLDNELILSVVDYLRSGPGLQLAA